MLRADADAGANRGANKAAPRRSRAPARVLALTLALALAGWALPARAFDLAELMAQLAQRPSGEARFAEQRFVSGLDQSLRSSGTLSFAAPDRLARLTLLPRAESFVVEGDRITLERGGRTRQVQIDSVPELAAMVAALRGTLTGDATTLLQHFVPSVGGSAAGWTLTLLPREPALAAIVRQLRLEGQQADLQRVEILLADGDRSVMTIEAIKLGAKNAQRLPAAPAELPGPARPADPLPAGKPRSTAP